LSIAESAGPSRLEPSRDGFFGDVLDVNGTVAHFTDTELDPGFHGIRWSWP
jgi:hypothetical protein